MPTRFSLLLALIAVQPAAAQTRYVLHNAHVYTVSAAQPTAQALAVEDGRLVAVGTEAEVLGARADWPRVNAGGQTVVPGLIDAHAHLMGIGSSLLRADLVGTTSKADVLARLQAFAETLPEGAWLLGRGWDQNDWPVAEDGSHPFPTREDLDRAFPDRPVWVRRIDGHAGWLNSAALRAAGLDPARPAPTDPEGGRILRDARGAAAGVLIDRAEDLVEAAVPLPSEAELEAQLERALSETARYGLTGLHDAGVNEDVLQVYRRFIAEGRFGLRVYAMVGGPGPTLDAVCEHGPHVDPRLSVRSLKLYADGALGSRGAALLEDYSDDHGNQGLLIIPPDSLAHIVTRAMGCGLQVNTHAIGDRGNRAVLDAYEAAIRATGGGTGRHRIEHAQVVAPEDFGRFGEMGIIASVQPTHATSDMPWAEERVGHDRIRGAYAWRRFLDGGTRLALGSDAPVESVNPLLGFYAAVTRQDAEGHPPGGWYPEQRLTREEALRGFTLDAAYAGFMEREVGSLEVGKRADFVILSRDVMQVPVAEILQTHVVATYLDGEEIYRSGDR